MSILSCGKYTKTSTQELQRKRGHNKLATIQKVYEVELLAKPCNLTEGELILSLDGDYGTVEAVILVEDANQAMYNLTVDEAHTFFVGEGDWLVHNCGDYDWIHDLLATGKAEKPGGINPEEAVDIIWDYLKVQDDLGFNLRLGHRSLSILDAGGNFYLGMSGDLTRRVSGHNYVDMRNLVNVYQGFTQIHSEAVALNHYWNAIKNGDVNPTRVAQMFTSREPCGSACLLDIDFQGIVPGANGVPGSQIIAGVQATGLERLDMSFVLNDSNTRDPMRFIEPWAKVTQNGWWGRINQ